MSDKLLVPTSIIIAGIIVATGFYLSGKNDEGAAKTPTASSVVKNAIRQASNIRPVDANDHILGNPDARVVVVEYSDTECPFCKDFHKTMRSLLNEYGSSGKVAWVYRHFPVPELHSKAPREAEALECAAALGGNSKFWEYTNRLYDVTPSNNNLNPAELLNIAKQVGLESDKFSTCLDSGEFAPRVEFDADDARRAGGEGTPFSVIVDTKSGDTYPINGAYPYAQMKNIIDLILES